MTIDFDSFTIGQVEKYLTNKGWTNKEGTWKKEWEDEGHYICLPPRNSIRYEECMTHLLEMISEGEQKNTLKIIEDIQVN